MASRTAPTVALRRITDRCRRSPLLFAARPSREAQPTLLDDLSSDTDTLVPSPFAHPHPGPTFVTLLLPRLVIVDTLPNCCTSARVAEERIWSAGPYYLRASSVEARHVRTHRKDKELIRACMRSRRRSTGAADAASALPRSQAVRRETDLGTPATCPSPQFPLHDRLLRDNFALPSTPWLSSRLVSASDSSRTTSRERRSRNCQ